MMRFLITLLTLALAPVAGAAAPTGTVLQYEDLLQHGAPEQLLRNLDTDPHASRSVAELLGRIEDAFRRQDFDAALRSAQVLRDIDPELPQGWYLIGVALANLGRAEDAIAALDQAAEKLTRNASPEIVKGDLLLAAGRTEASRDAFAAAVRKDPLDWRGHDGLAAAALRAGDTATARAHLQEAIAVAPETTLDPRLRLAAVLLAEGALEQATEVLRSFAQANPDNARAQVALGRIAFTQEDNAGAAALFARAIALEPDNAGLRVFKARAELNAGLFDAAEATLRAARTDMPGSPSVLMELGALHGVVRDYEAALAAFTEGSATWPDRIGFQRGAARAAYRLNRLETALVHARSAALHGAGAADDHVFHGAVLEALDRDVAARAAYEAALALDDDNWIALNNLAALLADVEPARAVILAQKALMASGGNAAVQATLGWATFRSGDAERAETLLRDVVTRVPDRALFRYRLGLVLMADGRSKEGRDEIAAALSLDPAFRFAEEARTLLARD